MHNRRSTKIVDRRLQGRLIFMAVSFTILASAAQIAFGAWAFSRATESLEPAVAESVMAEVPRLLVLGFGLGMVLLLPLFVFVTLYLTQPMFGPFVKFERFLTAVAEGRQVDDCRIRQGDFFQEHCALLNRVTEPLRANGRADNEDASSRAA